MKYIDADRMKAEIERRIELLKLIRKNSLTDGSIDAYKGSLMLIKSLQQEQAEKEKQLLQKNLNNDTTREDDYQFGRIMPFGKYKGLYVYYMILRHPRYSKWIKENTNFKFNETEMWWLNEIIDFVRLDNLISALGGAVIRYGELPENIENPHSIIE